MSRRSTTFRAAGLAVLLLLAIGAAPVLACGGLIGPNGAVNLLRTTTLAGYHDGQEHYITAFEFAGGGGAFGSLTPVSQKKSPSWRNVSVTPFTSPCAARTATQPPSSERTRARRAA